MMPIRWPRPQGTSRVEGTDTEPELVVDPRAGSARRGAGLLDADLGAGGPAPGRRRSAGRARRAPGRAARSPTGIRSGPPVCRTSAPTRSPAVAPSGRHTRPSRSAGGDLGEHRVTTGPLDLDEVADRGAQPGDEQVQADQLDDPAERGAARRRARARLAQVRRQRCSSQHLPAPGRARWPEPQVEHALVGLDERVAAPQARVGRHRDAEVRQLGELGQSLG